MAAERTFAASTNDAPRAGERVDSRRPRTARGERTRGLLLDAAAAEFGERGFHDASISAITRRAGVASGSFYTYFESKEEIFRALVQHMSGQVRDHVSPALEGAKGSIAAEGAALSAFLSFARDHKEIYRIIDEAEFVDPASFRAHYETTAQRIETRLRAGADRGEVCDRVNDVHAWAIMGMNVFLGLRFGVWDDSRPLADVVAEANRLIANGLSARPEPKPA